MPQEMTPLELECWRRGITLGRLQDNAIALYDAALAAKNAVTDAWTDEEEAWSLLHTAITAIHKP